MRLILFISFFILNPQFVFAQKEIKIDISHWKGKKESIPFTISQVEDNRLEKELIGMVYHKGKKKALEARFSFSFETMLEQFINSQFKSEDELPIKMMINELTILTEGEGKKRKHSFKMACTFSKLENGQAKLLYSFNGSNTVLGSKDPKTLVSNYIARALSSGINSFKKEFLLHPEWKEIGITAGGPKVTMNKKIIYNQFLTSDTVALSKSYKLSLSDFIAPVLEDEEDQAFSYFIITYEYAVEDTKNEVNLTIYPKGFLLKSRSWAKNAEKGSDWIYYQQLLFDLATLHSIALKNKFEDTKFSPGFYKSEMNRLYNTLHQAYLDEADKLQAETNFGEDDDKVKLWRELINQRLDALP